MFSSIIRPWMGAVVVALFCISALGLAAPASVGKNLEAAQSMLSDLPLHFEANQGQMDSRVRFQSRTPEHTLFLTGDEAVLSIRSGALRMSLAGGNSQPAIAGVDRLSSRSDYMIGRSKERWARNVPHFAKVRYEEAYPGIDLVYYGKGNQLEHDFVVRPGADPAIIRMVFSGADKISIRENGDLHFDIGGSEMLFSRPFIYQDGEAGRVEVAGNFVRLSKNEIGFSVADYDRSKTLVIDPVLSYSSYLGGSYLDVATAMTVDSQGFIWVTGYTETQDYPTAGRALQDFGGDRRNMFLTKINPFAFGFDSLAYSSFMGGTFAENPTAIEVDSAGNVYIVGDTTSGDFPATENGHIPDVAAGDLMGFLVKIDLDSTQDYPIVYGTYIGDEDDDEGADAATGLAIREPGIAYVCGYTNSEEFPLVNAAQGSGRGLDDAFIAVYDTNLSGADSLRYSSYLGGNSTDVATAILPIDQNVFLVTGYTYSTDFPTNGLPPSATPIGGGDVFLAQIDLSIPGLDGFRYGGYMGGTDLDVATGMRKDFEGKIYLAGYTLSTDFPVTADAIQPANGGGMDLFLSRIDLSLPGSIAYSTYYGGSDDEATYGVAVSESGFLLLGGYTYSTDFPLRGDVYHDHYQGVVDAFFTVIDPSKAGENAVVCSSYFGTDNLESVYGMGMDSLNNIFLVGEARSSAFPVTDGGFLKERPGRFSAFVSKFSACAGTAVEQSADYRPYPVNAGGRTAVPRSGRINQNTRPAGTRTRQ